MKLCVLGSGSRGNAVLMQSGGTRVLVDAGFGPKTIGKRLGAIGVDPRSIEAVVVTHEHGDHVQGAASCSAKWGWQIYATSGTCGASVALAEADVRTFSCAAPIAIGNVLVQAMPISHDATEPVAVIATGMSDGVRAAIVYDLGYMTETVQRAIERVEILVLESNHDGEMLRNGPYPSVLKRRIASRHGHLSNRAAGFAAAACAHRGLSQVVVAHLSEVNNTPGIAIASMRQALSRTSFRGNVTAALQDSPSRAISAERSTESFAVQLSLGL